MKNHYKENTDHLFENGSCVKCGWSKQWAKINGWKCPISESREKNSKEESFGKDEVNFLNHHFVDGHCKKCGWSYDWARKKNDECPVLGEEENSWNDYNRSGTHQNKRKDYQSTNEFIRSSDAVKYGMILELEGKVTIKDIKKNYRNLSKKYHPDRVNNLGREFSEIADKKMKDINEAYDWFKKKYNF